MFIEVDIPRSVLTAFHSSFNLPRYNLCAFRLSIVWSDRMLIIYNAGQIQPGAVARPIGQLTQLLLVVLSMSFLPRDAPRRLNPNVYITPQLEVIFPKARGTSHDPDTADSYTPQKLASLFMGASQAHDIAEHILITDAWHCKNNSGKRHEFVLLHVKDANKPDVVNYMVLERATKSRNIAKHFGAASGSDLIRADDIFRVSSSRDCEIFLKALKYDNHKVIREVTFSEDQPYRLYELIGLAIAVCEVKRFYNVVDAQCYWFAGSIWECMQNMLPHANWSDKSKRAEKYLDKVVSRRAEATKIVEMAESAREEIRKIMEELEQIREVSAFHASPITKLS